MAVLGVHDELEATHKLSDVQVRALNVAVLAGARDERALAVALPHTAVLLAVLGLCSWCLLLLQLSVLEIVGQRRIHGAVQTDMANQLGIQHRNFFYVLKARSTACTAQHALLRAASTAPAVPQPCACMHPRLLAP